ncbi:MAG: urea ABC transporter permease subunit UrtB, partial [Candidatus Methylumidiphilus sp.]
MPQQSDKPPMLARKERLVWLLASVLCGVALLLAGLLPAHADALAEAVQPLPSTPLAEMESAITRLTQTEDPRVPNLLKALRDNRLFAVKASGRVVFADSKDDGYRISDAVTGEALGEAGRFDVKKIAINNALRNVLSAAIAQLELSSPDAKQRLKAAESISQNPTPEAMALLIQQWRQETDGNVRDAMETAIALADLARPDKALRIKAIHTLEGNLNQEVRNRLAVLQEKNDAGEYVEPDSDIRNLAAVALKKIEFKLEMNHLAETLFFGLSLGAVLVLSAIGLAITFGVMGVIN